MNMVVASKLVIPFDTTHKSVIKFNRLGASNNSSATILVPSNASILSFHVQEVEDFLSSKESSERACFHL